MEARHRSRWHNIGGTLWSNRGGFRVERRHRSRWHNIKEHPYATGILVLLVLVLFILLAYLFRWDWTGFDSGTNQITITSTSKVNYTATISQPSKSLWDWLQLLGVLAIPVVVGFGAVWFTIQQGKVADVENTDNQRETALQAYIDKMSELLLKEHLRVSQPEDEVRKIARIRTITILTQLDARRIGSVFSFLRETGLMSVTDNNSVVSLRGADLHEVNWSRADIHEADLREADLNRANLSLIRLFKASIRGANLVGADLRGAYLSKSDLSNSNLNWADLSLVGLSEADLSSAYIQFANLSEANLSGANLTNADLTNANLNDANLTDAKVSTQQLKQAKSLKGATMPDGSIHP